MLRVRPPFNTSPHRLRQALNLYRSHLEPASLTGYMSGLNCYMDFIRIDNVDDDIAFPVTSELLLGWVTYCTFDRRVTYRTICAYKAALRYFSLRFGHSIAAFSNDIITQALRASRKLAKPPPKSVRLPLTLPLLEKVLRVIPSQYTFLPDAAMIAAMLTFGFCGGVRPSAYVQRFTRGIEVGAQLSWRHLQFVGDKIIVHLQRSKTDPFRIGRQIELFDTRCAVNPVSSLLRWRENLENRGLLTLMDGYSNGLSQAHR